MEFEVITDCSGVSAVLIDNHINSRRHPGLFLTLHSFVRGESFDQPVLARRWGIGHVLSTNDWASAQLRRKPMFKPKGHRFSSL